MKKHLFKDKLSTLTKADINFILEEFALLSDIDTKAIKKLRKDDEIKIILFSLKNYLTDIFNEFYIKDYKALKQLLSYKTIRKVDLGYDEIKVLNCLEKYDLVFSLKKNNRIVYYFYSDIKKIAIELLSNKEILKYIKQQENERILSCGIINAYGAITFTNFCLLLNEKYPDLSKELILKHINNQIVIQKEYKIYNKKDDIVLYNKHFSSIKDVKKIVKEDIYSYPYEDYLSFGKRDYKYNPEYKRFIKLIKNKYVYQKGDLYFFQRVVLDKYVDLYRINIDDATTFLDKSIQDRFEYKNDGLKNKLREQITLLAKAEPNWEEKNE